MNILAYVHLRNIVDSTGAGRVARNMTEQLVALGQDNVNILADAGDHRRIVGQAGEPWVGYRYHLFDNDTSRQQRRWFFLGTPKAENFWPDIDILYCTAESYVPTRRARSAVTLHDAAFFETDALSRDWSSRRQKLKWTFLYRLLERKVDLFHTVSEFSAERIGHFFPGLRSRLRVIPNGVVDRFFCPPGPEGLSALTGLGLLDREFILLPRGLHFRKNADLVLNAWPVLLELHPDLMLVVSSHSDPAYVEKMRSLGPSVKIVGFVSDEVLCALYDAATLVWFPSRYEGFGIPVLEAMACGTPVVASDAASLPEVAGDAAMLVPPADARAHVGALDELLHNSARRQGLADKGRERAAQFTWRSAAVQLRKELACLQ